SHNKKMELLNAKKWLVSEAKAQETREALGQSVSKMPDEATQARHRSALSVEHVQITMREQMG
ncbi:MAG: hypothetical protein MI747_12945, partial [Desulfobacterales bacterium]|nr:hypothetical protein [Desulfobacterales bacterium]